jgi:replication factor C small subunit
MERLSEGIVDRGKNDESIAHVIVKISGTDALLKDTANERIQLEKLILSFS